MKIKPKGAQTLAQIRKYKIHYSTPTQSELNYAYDSICAECYSRGRTMYKDEEFFSTRLEEELAYIKEKGKSYELRIIGAIFDFSDIKNYPVMWQRGALPRDSLVLYLLGFSNKNPLPPHYRCPKCRRLEAVDARNYAHGFDLPDKKCSVCDIMMIKDGHDIKVDLAGYKWGEYPVVLGINKSIVKGLQKHIDYLFGAYRPSHTTVDCIHLQNEVKCKKKDKNPYVSRWYECKYYKLRR